jgi:hypothetical protein
MVARTCARLTIGMHMCCEASGRTAAASAGGPQQAPGPSHATSHEPALTRI